MSTLFKCIKYVYFVHQLKHCSHTSTQPFPLQNNCGSVNRLCWTSLSLSVPLLDLELTRGKTRSTAATLYPPGHVPHMPDWKLPPREMRSTYSYIFLHYIECLWDMWSRLAEGPVCEIEKLNQHTVLKLMAIFCRTNQAEELLFWAESLDGVAKLCTCLCVSVLLRAPEEQRAAGETLWPSDCFHNCLLTLGVRGHEGVWSSTRGCGTDAVLDGNIYLDLFLVSSN